MGDVGREGRGVERKPLSWENTRPLGLSPSRRESRQLSYACRAPFNCRPRPRRTIKRHAATFVFLLGPCPPLSASTSAGI